MVIESDSKLIPQQQEHLLEVFTKYEEYCWETPTIVLLGSVYDGKPKVVRWIFRDFFLRDTQLNVDDGDVINGFPRAVGM